MFRFFRKHQKVVMVSMVLCIVGLLLFGVGDLSVSSSPQDTIMKVNGKKISQIQFDRVYNQLSRQRTDATPQQQSQLQSNALNEVIRMEVFSQEAKKYDIVVTNQELQQNLLGIPAFQKDGKFDYGVYLQTVNRVFGVSHVEFEKNHKKDIAASKLNRLVGSSVHITDDQLAAEMANVARMETDKKKLKELQDNPEKLRELIQQQESNILFSDWLNQLNSSLKVTFVSDTFRKRMEAPVPAPQ